jgi:predicted DCC family thiol-disulfide oxidoreductase YuxK
MDQPLNPDSDKPVVLYDGVCNFCNLIVNTVLKNDSNKIFLFSPLQSKHARALLRKHNEAFVSLQTVYLVMEGKTYKRSKAVFKIFEKLDYPYKALSICRFLPVSLTDWGYKMVAKYRYKLFGQQKEIIAPPAESAHRFIS